MIKCKSCTREIAEDIKFCPHCGTEVVVEPEKKPQDNSQVNNKPANVQVNLDETLQSIATKINERLENRKPEKDPLDQEAIQKMIMDQIKLSDEEARKQPLPLTRKGEFAIEPEGQFGGKYTMRELIYMPTTRSPQQILEGQYPVDDFHQAVTQLQEWNDKIYLIAFSLGVNPKSLRSYKMFQSIFDNSPLKRALDTQTSTEGAEWIPTGFSARLTERYLLELKIAALFEIIEMPTSPFTIPYEASGFTGYYISESIGDSSTKIKASTPGTGNKTFTARKLATRGLVSEEADEDSIIPMIPFMERSIAVAIAEAKEDALFNGDRTTAGHQDTIADTEDARYAWDGLRYMTQAGEKVSFADANPTAALMRDVRQLMGKYGVDPTKLAQIGSSNWYLKLLEDGDVRTLDKFGPQATVLKGELGKLDGIPVIVTEKSRDTYDSTGVGTSSDRGITQMVFRPGLAVGQRKGITLKWREDIETDQRILVAKVRADFQSLIDNTAEAINAQGYNINAD